MNINKTTQIVSDQLSLDSLEKLKLSMSKTEIVGYSDLAKR